MAVEIEGRLVADGREVRVEIADGMVRDVRPGAGRSGVWIAPGFVDLQVNGYRGSDVNSATAGPEMLARLVGEEWAQGVTAFCPTVVTASEESIIGRLQAISAARKADEVIASAIPCAHVEGPHLSAVDGPRGVHDATMLRPFDVEEYRRWQRAADGVVGMVTVAPELPGAIDYIRAVAADGVVVAIGHTACTPEQVTAAVDAGARLSTHLGNGAHAQLARHPNYIWQQLAEDRLAASFIADGHHLPAATLKAMVRAKGVSRSVLVSDSTALAGLPAGRYDTPVGGVVELHPDGRLSLPGTPFLAGSARSLTDCMAGAVGAGAASVADSVRMASTNPRRLLGLPDGNVRVGASADISAFRWDERSGIITPVVTVCKGRVVYRNPTEGL